MEDENLDDHVSGLGKSLSEIQLDGNPVHQVFTDRRLLVTNKLTDWITG